MPRFGPVARQDLIAALRAAGFSGPFPGTRHEFMTRGATRLIVPNPHHGEVIGAPLLRRILREAGIRRQEWEKL
ncbi:MAG: type II toxin-antitoxin system HicA family toxin [Chloroflexi bacterium]|nr:type II toxin-antitoxin system HicA family toxin [Chloroflexota bacterium]